MKQGNGSPAASSSPIVKETEFLTFFLEFR